MARRRRNACGLCGALAGDEPLEHFAVHLGKKWVERFTYPPIVATTPEQKKARLDWERSDGVRIADSCKAVLAEGARPFLWVGEGSWQSAATVAEFVGGEALVEWVCSRCAKANLAAAAKSPRDGAAT